MAYRNTRYPTGLRKTPQLRPMDTLSALRKASAERNAELRALAERVEQLRADLPVNSIEAQDPYKPLVGLKHYLDLVQQSGLNTKPSLDDLSPATPSHTCAGATLTDDPALDHFSHHTPIAAPLPTLSRVDYTHPIYTGTTHNPAVFLSILHIAQRYRPDINFISALNHIPNVRPTDNLPVLRPAAQGNIAPQRFLESTLESPKREDDDEIHVAFLPDFYDAGERHAIGFFAICTGLVQERTLGNAFFTPCSEEDLKRYGLVEYTDGWKGTGEYGVQAMTRVGCLDGRWVDPDTVEDYADWKLVFQVASQTWERRMGIVMGRTEAVD